MYLELRNNNVYVTVDEKNRRKFIELRGFWSLDHNHQIRFHLNAKEASFFPKIIRFQTEILSLDNNSISLSVTHKERLFKKRTIVFQLKGQWFLDRYNRLRFQIKRTDGPNERLRFDGHWNINKNHNITYNVSELSRAPKQKMVLKGKWKIVNDRYLAYHFARGDQEPLLLRVYLQTQQIRAKKDHLRYRWGIGFYRKKRARRQISFIGLWRVSHHFDVQFEAYSKNSHETYHFMIKSVIWKSSYWMLDVVYHNGYVQRFKIRIDSTFFGSRSAFFSWQASIHKEWDIQMGVSFVF